MSKTHLAAIDALTTLGTSPIPQDSPRDAVHIAVAPVRSNERLYAGQHIGLVAGSIDLVTTTASELIGIVDPFLSSSTVYPNQTFWMFLYPRTITSLSHAWSHPAFVQPVPIESPPVLLSEKEQSMEWIKEYSRNYCDGLSYEELMAAASSYQKWGDYLSHGPRFEGVYIDDAFWDHYNIAMNTEVTDRGNFFSCSC